MTHDELLKQLKPTDTPFPKYSPNSVVNALISVVELHKPILWQKIEMVCDGCGMDIEQNYNSAYPCETIEAIERELK